MRLDSLKIATLALGIVGLVSAAPRAQATTISVTDGGNTFTINYTLKGDVLTINSFDLNGLGEDGGKIFVVGAIGTSVTVTDNTGVFTKTASGEGPFKGMIGLKSKGGDSTFPIATFTLGGTATDLVFHLGGFTSTGCSIWIEGPVGGSTGSDNGSLAKCGGSTTPPPTVPEPGTLGLLGTGLVGIAGLVRRRFGR